MPTFMCFLNWTDQGAKAVKDAPQRYEATKALVAKLGGRLASAYVTTGQYDVVVTVEMPRILRAGCRRRRSHGPQAGRGEPLRSPPDKC